MIFRPLFRALRLALLGRIDCAPRFDSRAPYPGLDNPGLENPRLSDLRPIVVEPLNRHTERVYYGPGHHHHFLRYTAAWHEDEARRLAGAWGPMLHEDQPKHRRRWRDAPLPGPGGGK